MRSIRKIYPAERVRMGEILLDQPLPARGLDQVDPFLLVHHWEDTLKGGEHPSQLGVGPHPHRGFTPATFIFKGKLHHRDSTGRSDIVEAGGVQWMNSGRGIVHSERPPKDLAAEGGDFEIIQFWVNAPAAKKMDAPSYQPLQAVDTPVIRSEDGKARIDLVAGQFAGKEGRIESHSPLLILRVDIQAGGKAELPIPPHYNAFIYQLDGALTINGGTATKAKDLTLFNNDGPGITVEAVEDTRLILLSGEPINEPVATYGPFVMNSQEEVMQALRDYQMGKMGELVEEFN